jgi:hypothetical protein
MVAFRLIDKLLEILYFIMLLIFALFIDYKFLPVVSSEKKRKKFSVEESKISRIYCSS